MVLFNILFSPITMILPIFPDIVPKGGYQKKTNNHIHLFLSKQRKQDSLPHLRSPGLLISWHIKQHRYIKMIYKQKIVCYFSVIFYVYMFKKMCEWFFLNYKIYRESLKRNEINFKNENLKFTKKISKFGCSTKNIKRMEAIFFLANYQKERIFPESRRAKKIK